MVIWRAGVPLLALAVLSLASCGGETKEESFVDVDGPGGPTSLISVIAESEVVLLSILTGQHEEVVELISPATGSPAGKRIELVREFSVSELLRDGSDVAETVAVRATLEVETWRTGPDDVRSTKFEVIELEIGRNYVLFLNAADDSEGVAFVPQGPMSIALVENEQLTFLVTEEYRADVAAAGLYEPGKTGLGESFDVTLADLRSMVARTPYAPLASEPDPTEVARISGIQAQQAIAVDVWQQAMAGDFRSAAEIEARMAELGFDPAGLGDDPLACQGVERLFSDLGFVVDLGCH